MSDDCTGCGLPIADRSIAVDGGHWHFPCWEPRREAYEERCRLAYAKPGEPRTWGVKLLRGGVDLWWRDWGCGYTSNVAEAGLFSERFARGQESKSSGDRTDRAVPPDEMRRLIEHQRDAALDRLRVMAGGVQ